MIPWPHEREGESRGDFYHVIWSDAKSGAAAVKVR